MTGAFGVLSTNFSFFSFSNMHLYQLTLQSKLSNLTSLCILLIFASCLPSKDVYRISRNATTEIFTSGVSDYTASIQNKTQQPIEVSVHNAQTNQQIRGGLGPKARADVIVESSSVLKLNKTKGSKSKVAVIFSPLTKDSEVPATKAIRFTLRNNTSKSIPLIIPSVMNPNLSSYSNSGVRLKIGQNIYFKIRGNRHLLLTVDSSIKDDDILDVAQILSQRKKELSL